MKTNNISITINRQLGSGGAYVGQQLADKLGYKYLDHELLRKAAESLHYSEDEIDPIEERNQSFWEYALFNQQFNCFNYIPPVFNFPTSLELYEKESKIISDCAQKDNCVIVGRCASYILKDNPNNFSIFLYADKALRQKRIEELYNLPPQEAKKRIEKSDIERRKYYNSYTGMDWTDATQYHLSINTGRIELDKAVSLILNYITERFKITV
jgi:cytidylate kinase